MKRKTGCDFLIRNMPIEVYALLDKSAKEHHRSKNQEAIIVLAMGLSVEGHSVQKPEPMKWKKKISSEFIDDAIREGRE